MKETHALIDKARKYLKSADMLFKGEDCESCVSRVYYAMFYATEALLLTKKGLTFSSHKAVISAFGEHFVKSGIFPKEMGKELNRAFEKRQLGDYEYTSVISKDEAVAILQQGKKFVDRVSEYLKGIQ